MRNEFVADMCCDVPSMAVEKSSGRRWDSDRFAGRSGATGLGFRNRGKTVGTPVLGSPSRLILSAALRDFRCTCHSGRTEPRSDVMVKWCDDRVPGDFQPAT